MPGLGFIHLLVIIITAILFIVGLLVFSRHKKLSTVLFGVSFYLVISTFYCKSTLVKDGEKVRVGNFKLDYKNSSFGNLNLSDHANVILEVQPNNTFEIIGDIPLENKTGKWTYIDDGDISFIEYIFDEEAIVSQVQSSGVDSWVIVSNGFAKPDKTYKLIFIRQ